MYRQGSKKKSKSGISILPVKKDTENSIEGQKEKEALAVRK
jgi:hypothetical protein